MSTPDQPGTPPLTRRQLRELRNTASTPVIAPEDAERDAQEKAAAADSAPERAESAPEGAPSAPEADSSAPEPDAPAPADEPTTDAATDTVPASSAPATPVPPAPAVELDGAPVMTRRQARLVQRMRTEQIGIMTDATGAEAAADERAPADTSEWAPPADEAPTAPAEAPEAPEIVDGYPGAEPAAEPADTDAPEAAEAEPVDEADVADEADTVDETEGADDAEPVIEAENTEPDADEADAVVDEDAEPEVLVQEGTAPTDATTVEAEVVSEDAVAEAPAVDDAAESVDAAEASDADEASVAAEEQATDAAEESRPVVAPALGAKLLSGEAVDAALPPAFDNLLSRPGSGSTSTPNALILSQTPETGAISMPITATGELLITGSYALPDHYGSTGTVPGAADGKEIDATLVDGELPPASSPTPIAASAAISTIKSAEDIIRPPAPEKGSKLIMTLAITAGVLAVALAGALILSLVNGVF